MITVPPAPIRVSTSANWGRTSAHHWAHCSPKENARGVLPRLWGGGGGRPPRHKEDTPPLTAQASLLENDLLRDLEGGEAEGGAEGRGLGTRARSLSSPGTWFSCGGSSCLPGGASLRGGLFRIVRGSLQRAGCRVGDPSPCGRPGNTLQRSRRESPGTQGRESRKRCRTWLGRGLFFWLW